MASISISLDEKRYKDKEKNIKIHKGEIKESAWILAVHLTFGECVYLH